MRDGYRGADRRERRRRQRAKLRRTFDTSLRTLLRIRVVFHACLPAVVLLLAAVVLLDVSGVGGPGVARPLVYAEYLVLGYFAAELVLDFVLYRDKRSFVRDRWIDVALLVPVVLLVRFGAWIGGIVLVGRALRTMEFVEAVGLEVFAIEELTVPGSRLQRALKLFRRGRRVFRPARPE